MHSTCHMISFSSRNKRALFHESFTKPLYKVQFQRKKKRNTEQLKYPRPNRPMVISFF